jgi:death-on-curing protein
MKQPRFLSVGELVVLHHELVATFGGAPGLRDKGALVSAAMAPQNHWFYSKEGGDPFLLAGVLLIHLGRNPPFVDCNKRVAAAGALVMLELNGIPLRADDDALETATMQAVKGKLELEGLVELFRSLAENT